MTEDDEDRVVYPDALIIKITDSIISHSKYVSKNVVFEKSRVVEGGLFVALRHQEHGLVYTHIDGEGMQQLMEYCYSLLVKEEE